MIDPNTPPPLPPQITTARKVARVDGSRTQCVTVRDAARLLGTSEEYVHDKINRGLVDICRDGAQQFVLIDSLWLLVPEEDRRAE